MSMESILALCVSLPIFLFFSLIVPILKKYCKGMMSTRWMIVSYSAALMMMLVLDFSWLDAPSRQIVLSICGAIMCIYLVVKSIEKWLSMGYVGNVELKKGDASAKLGISHSGELRQPLFTQSEEGESK